MLDFSKFISKISKTRTPTSERAYSKFGYRMNNPVRHSFELDEIKNLIRTGEPVDLRELSRYYYRVSGIYRSIIDLMATMAKYDTIVTPRYDIKKKVPKTQLINAFYSACDFVDNLHVPVNFTRITREIMISGVYYGILRQNGDEVTFHDLPISYCRSRFKDGNDLEILEFNILYFNSITDGLYKKAALEAYPQEIQKAYYEYSSGARTDYWVEIPASAGGISFSFGDKTPPFAASIPSIYQLEDAIERESERDENELYKLLIQKMPIDNKGELIFPLEEVADIHASVAEMLSGTDTVDVLTTFGDTSLESLQDSTAATQSTSRIKKYVDTTYDELGVSQLLFNSDTASSLEYTIKKQEAMIRELLNIYSVWIKYLINSKFEKPKFSFDFEILPTTVYNQKEVQEKYFQGAQYGYSKMYAGVSLGIKQQSQICLMEFENEFLDMTEKMIPLQSTYTSSGKVEKSATNTIKEDTTVETEEKIEKETTVSENSEDTDT